MHKIQKGQGLLEYAIILVLVAVVVFIILNILFVAPSPKGNISSSSIPDLPEGRFPIVKLQLISESQNNGFGSNFYETVLADTEGKGRFKWYKIGPKNDHVLDANKGECYQSDKDSTVLHLATSCEPQAPAQ